MKYIIEVPDAARRILMVSANEKAEIWSVSIDVDNLEVLNADYVNEHFSVLQDDAYNAGLEKGKKEAYQRGLEDGKWKSEDGCTGCKYEGKVVTGTPCISCCNSYKNLWTAKSDKIEVGDEVLWDGEKHIVTRINRDVDLVEVKDYDLMSEYGSAIDHVSKYAFTKTGRHFDIKGILEAMHG